MGQSISNSDIAPLFVKMAQNPRCWGQNTSRIQNKEVYATLSPDLRRCVTIMCEVAAVPLALALFSKRARAKKLWLFGGCAVELSEPLAPIHHTWKYAANIRPDVYICSANVQYTAFLIIKMLFPTANLLRVHLHSHLPCHAMPFH